MVWKVTASLGGGWFLGMVIIIIWKIFGYGSQKLFFCSLCVCVWFFYEAYAVAPSSNSPKGSRAALAFLGLWHFVSSFTIPWMVKLGKILTCKHLCHGVWTCLATYLSFISPRVELPWFIWCWWYMRMPYLAVCICYQRGLLFYFPPKYIFYRNY